MDYQTVEKRARHAVYALIGLVAVVILACLAAGCQVSCPDCTDPARHGQRPHVVQIGAQHTGRTVQVCSGDDLYVTIPCTPAGCYLQHGVSAPFLVREPTSQAGVFRFRAACPGQCLLMFRQGSYEVKYLVNIRP